MSSDVRHNGHEYRTGEFAVRVEPIVREAVSVIYTRDGVSLNLDAERIGSKWEGIEVLIPQEVEAGQVPQLVRDLQTAFAAMQYGYVITRKVGTEIVPEPERQAAIAELREMGYETEILPDGVIRQTRRAGATCPDIETLRKMAPRTMALVETVRGRRQRFEILAKSKDF